MENYSYNSYTDSGTSSPPSREIDFENPPPWEDQSQNYKIKFMCSYGGKIHPRPNDNQLSYIGGDTKILSVDRNIKFSSVISKLSALCGGESEVSFKYQLPGEDLDALISVSNDDDLEHMMLEYDRMYRASPKPARMRLFIFPISGPSASFASDGGKSERERFVEALNSSPGQGTEKIAAIPPNKVEFLFGLEKEMAPPPPIKIHNPGLDVAPPPPPPPSISEVVGSDHFLNPMEVQRQLHELQLQRLQIREQEQQAVYLKKNEESNSVAYTGEYYTQNLPEKAPPVNLPVAVQQQSVPAPAGYWPEKQIPASGYPAAVTAHPSEHPVYMIPAPPPGTIYHAPSPIPAPAPVPLSAPPPPMVRPMMSGQPAGQGYYTNVQRMPAEVYREHAMYNIAAPGHPPPISTVQQQVGRPSGGVAEPGYPQVQAYERQVYYTAPGGGVVLQPQYQGVGMTATGETRAAAGEAKLVTKVSQA